jgi:hyaluronan synthase
MATIVGYREDPDLFTRALDSYKTAAECRFVLVGVDGDDTPDMEMVDVFQGVSSTTIVYKYRTNVTYSLSQ